MLKSTFIGLLLLLTPASSYSYFELVDTGKLVDEGSYQVYGGIQGIIDTYSGANVTGRFSTGLTGDSEVQAELGLGTIDFQFTGYYKWIPIPDYQDQPAMGAKIGVHYARVASFGIFTVTASPLISKLFKSNVGDFTPYAGLPIGLHFLEGDTDLTMGLNLGCEWTTLKWNNVHFYFEAGFNLIKTFPAVIAGVSYDFEG